jgi:hypothetical protein
MAAPDTGGFTEESKRLVVELIPKGDLDPTVKQLRKVEIQGDRTTTSTVSLDRSSKHYGETVKGVSTKVGGFKMQLLSTMFFGYMLQRTFGGMIQPLLELFGVFEYFGVMLMDLLLPVLEPLIDILFNLMDWVMNLDPGMKNLIGSVIIILAVLGLLIGAVSAVALGIKGLVALLGGPAVYAFAIIMAKLIAFGIALYAAFSIGYWLGQQIGIIIKNVITAFGNLFNWIFKTLDSITGGLVSKALSLGQNIVMGIVNGIYSLSNMISNALWSLVPNELRSVIQGIGNAASGRWLPWFQEGGVVPGTGPVPIMAHGGETIIPAGMSPMTNINISVGSISSEIDVKHLADVISKRLYEDARWK